MLAPQLIKSIFFARVSGWELNLQCDQLRESTFCPIFTKIPNLPYGLTLSLTVWLRPTIHGCGSARRQVKWIILVYCLDIKIKVKLSYKIWKAQWICPWRIKTISAKKSAQVSTSLELFFKDGFYPFFPVRTTNPLLRSILINWTFYHNNLFCLHWESNLWSTL